MSMDYIRKAYGVPAKRGGRIRYTGKDNPELGTIVWASTHLHVRMDSTKMILIFHPTWQIEYLGPTSPPTPSTH